MGRNNSKSNSTKSLCAFCKTRYSVVSIPVGNRKIPICGTEECRRQYELRKKMSRPWQTSLIEYMRSKEREKEQASSHGAASSFNGAIMSERAGERIPPVSAEEAAAIQEQLVAAIEQLDEKSMNDASSLISIENSGSKKNNEIASNESETTSGVSNIRPKRKRATPEIKKKIQEMYDQGLSYKEISEKLNVTESMIKRSVKNKNRKQRSYECPHCPEILSTVKELLNHTKQVHGDDKPFKCSIEGCDYSAKTKGGLQQHISYRHSEERPYKCPFEGCEYAAKNKQHLDSHISYRHSEERPYKCPFEGCEYAAKTNGDLQSHLTFRHTTERPFKCPHDHCDYKGAKMMYELKAHIKHRHSSERPYKCPDCDYSAKTSGDLSIHLKSNSCGLGSDKATRQGHQWEALGKEIAEILLVGESWVWKPTIETPEIPEYNHVQPDIVIYDKNKKIKKIIDLKRSPVAIHSFKDLTIYPTLSPEVTFWFLYADEDLSFAFGFRTSTDLIQMLKEKIRSAPELENTIKHIIKKIRLLREGIDPNSPILDDFSE